MLALTAAVIAQEKATVWDGVYTDAQAQRGRPLYSRECGSCHGESMTGGEMAPPLAGGEFLSNWSGLTVAELFDRIRNTMPMAKPKSLSRQVNADILAYIFAVNRFPAGANELPVDNESQKQIMVEATKPSK